MISLSGRKKTFILITGGALISLITLCSLGFASGGGENGNHGSGEMLDLLYRGINFALLVIILFVVIRKTAVRNFFSDRREDIRRKLDDLKSEKSAAESRFKELKKKLEEFEVKKNEIIAQFKAEGEAEKETIIAEAKEKAKQILAQTDVTIEREIQIARDRLRQGVVDVAIQKAQKIIVKEIKDSDQERLVNQLIERMEKLH